MTTRRMISIAFRRWTLRQLLKEWLAAQLHARQLRHLDELPDYLLRDVGLDHLTKEERYQMMRH